MSRENQQDAKSHKKKILNHIQLEDKKFCPFKIRMKDN